MLLALGFALHLPAAQPCPLGTHGHRNMASSGMGPDTQRPEPCSHTEMSGLLSSSATLPDARRIAVCLGAAVPFLLVPQWKPVVEALSRGRLGLHQRTPKWARLHARLGHDSRHKQVPQGFERHDGVLLVAS